MLSVNFISNTLLFSLVVNHFVLYKNVNTVKNCFEQLLSKIYAKNFRKNNQRVSIDYLKRRSDKNKFECKSCGCSDFYVLDYQNSSFEILPSS